MKSLGLFRKSPDVAFEYIFFPDQRLAIAVRIPSYVGAGNVVCEVTADTEPEAIARLDEEVGRINS